MAYILDTNVFYDISDPVSTAPKTIERLCEMGCSGSLDLRFSPIAVIEIVSRLVREPTRFDQLKRAAEIVVQSRARCLPDPEQRMREILYDGDIAKGLYSHWDTILETLSRAPNVQAFQRGFDDIATATRRSVDIAHIHAFREEYERQFTIDMFELAKRFNPRYEKQSLKSKPTKLSQKEILALEAFLMSPEWNAVFREMLAARADCPLPTDSGRLGVVDTKSYLFRAGYEWVIRKTFCDGRHVKHDDKNDYNDMHLLLHVNAFSFDIIVSSDVVKSVLFDVASSLGKTRTLAQFIDGELTK